MEWVETTGRTVEEALEVALDQLGVDADDAEYEVLEEPRLGLFGRLRTEARLRVRVRPTKPRPKEERRGRTRKATAKAAAAPAGPNGGTADDDDEATTPAAHTTPKIAATNGADAGEGDRPMSDTTDMSLREQGEAAARFLEGFLERFGATAARVSIHELEAETVEVRVEGDDLGLLIGPKGAALQALQELTRAAVQRQAAGRTGRLLVDVSGYRERRRVALERFAHKVADDVRNSGTRIVLEPMNPADRKVIHDTINEIDGVSTSSEGEEPRRRVVISPA